MTVTNIDLRAATVNLEIEYGDDNVIQFTFTNPNGTQFDLTGYTNWTAAGVYDGATLPFTIDTSNQVSSIILVSIPAATSTQLADGWRWDLRVSPPNTTHRLTLFEGRFVNGRRTVAA
jgi:hypothetical protein